MELPDFLTTEISISLTEDKSGFVYRVKRLGIRGPRRFVASPADSDDENSTAPARYHSNQSKKGEK
ncbi:MAG TPA: hypothetical protein VFA04_24950 [Bryobacteraceae bacterium]|jgi:hypothetical protein|nr:hypothetical protein [Bryobacteraceae bacterium]